MVSSLKNGVPGDFIPHRKDISLGMEVFSHAYLAEADNGHNTNIERKHGAALLIARNRGNAKTFGRHSVSLKALGFCMTLDI